MEKLKEIKVGKSTVSHLTFNDKQYSSEEVLNSWLRSIFSFKEENNSIGIGGLRPPQLGAIFSTLGYEKSDDRNAATIVMPTGTGKTETILSIVVAGKFKKTLVIVPSDPLREQTKKKFLRLGLLRDLDLVKSDVLYPIVSTIKHGINDLKELDQILSANVLIATASSLSKFSSECFNRLVDECTHLIVDEAHHVTAVTWAKIKTSFTGKSIYQFTATPFRNDGSRVEGKIIFNYPLKQAQEDGYFKPIIFYPVREYVDDKSDEAIAEQAITLLKDDLKEGFDHMIMARVSSIQRAHSIFEIYSKEKDLNPIIITSRVRNKQKILEAIKARKHKIIICVNMLGEGFDLPQLKISAIHDPHKSISVMLQFIGRFTRTTKNVSDAKFVANIANPSVNESLDELYKEDADWNVVVRNISASKIHNEKKYQEFRSKFSTPSSLLDLGLTPNISTVIYKMRNAQWTPENLGDFGNQQYSIVESVLNDEQDMLIFSVKSYSPVVWSSSKEVFNESWDLYVAFYYKAKNLLFIHSSTKDGLVSKLVGFIAKGATLLQGEQIFRALAGIKRLKLQNVGLNKNKKGLRYSMHTGTEINEQIPDIEANRAVKSNIFGKGYERGQLVSIGCSYKGKVWAMDSDTLDQWISWCKGVGAKVLDNTIDTNEVMKTAMQTEILKEFPNTRILSVEWPLFILKKNASKVVIKSLTWEEKLINCDLTLSNTYNLDSKNIILSLKKQDGVSDIIMSLQDNEEVVFHSREFLDIQIGEQTFKLDEFFAQHPPTLFLSDTSVINGCLRHYLNDGYTYKYDIEKTEVWNWQNIDISVESQTINKIKNSIQYHVIQEIFEDYDVIFDDDGSGEVADIVAIKKISDRQFVIDLYHCKYCPKIKGKTKPGARVDDVYQVVGQAEKSIKWFANKEELFLRLVQRERDRLKKNQTSRVEKGTLQDLITYSKMAKSADFQDGMVIVQPAISKEKMSDDQLIVIGSTAAYIEEISGIKLRVIINK